MNYLTSITNFSDTAHSKRFLLENQPMEFFALAMMAGAYVGLGILLIFSVGQGVSESIRPIVMGASFGIALMLVIFAGSELFTGHTMYMTIGALTGRTSIKDLAKCWSVSWCGNLIGALFLAVLFVYGGGGRVLGSDDSNLVLDIAEKKMAADALALFLNGILCNWLVCLAIWTSSRVKSDTAKIALIWFCLYAFIAAGFEHSVANMTVFSVALLSEQNEAISLLGALRNLAFVSAGNAVAGAGIMGLGYWIAAGSPHLLNEARAQSCTAKIEDRQSDL
ncbi:formate/nitrite transporter family protein [Phaeobacter gallaeciensis]|uniref:Formate/nitrite family of transporter n=1 Tax=Phaeobacter gallaeciensis TaxID=60890 RepID=A0AAD0EC97_9RHOB|nr:formate/nitrite transporter family protein [Phaeobacter gallaeciensis]AHD08915.1 Formate/nitrite family of transporter [Phaeobacter gallaeciensis DSM 26640]ATE92181.1 Formate/nitrite family of transporter [Phaeobacter gallaeciensis]ATE98000.1 Formate/nitrite family of transporter [Phaeobacter gallaeciensis]ATF00843.1 Formate/nitrite family of transporter [Phaeobacter gallaeciensis]ATF05223.1 Formate/nitrite family of transporter [Phaeobacter gallaeciensis]